MAPYVLVLYYSHQGSVAKLAQYIARGVEHVSGLSAMLRTVPRVSTTCEAVDPLVPEQGAPYVTLDELRHCSGLALGSPTRFGNMAASMRYFWDSTSALWMSGDLVNKPACVFTSTASMHGGQETTLMTMMNTLFHHGMLVMGVPFTEPELTSTQSGGTPYGVTHVSGAKGETLLTQDEMILAKKQGERLAKLVKQLKSH